VQGSRTRRDQAGLERRANGRICPRELELVEQCSYVKTRTTHDDDAVASLLDRHDVRARRALVGGNGGVIGQVEHVELVVRDPATALDRQLGSTDVHPAVELHRVGVHDLRPDALRERDCKIGFPRRRGADDGDHQRGHRGTTGREHGSDRR